MDEQSADAFAERLFGAGLGTVDVLTVYIGDRLGYYAALADADALTPAELATKTGTNERYAREWLEQQAVTGIIDASGSSFSLPPAHAEVLTEPDNLAAMAWLPRLLVSGAQALPKILEAFRTGGGVSWSDFGADAIEGQADQNRPVFEHLLTKEWLPSIPDVEERLRRAGARVADVCCGAGLSSIAIARDYPEAAVDGFDLDPMSIGLAKQNAKNAGLSDRLSFEVRDAADPAHAGLYDVVLVFESIHDLSQPVEVLRAMRTLAKPDGAVIVMDERVADSFTAPGDEVERLMYGYSVLLCLPAGMADKPSAETGTVMRTDTMRAYASEAGFKEVEVLPIEHAFFRFYRLHWA
ncbi:MAG TPA: methyltransferase domain-containing protein [Actinomycetota bacterium]|jgi:2-polyprenyl-3-methyl-5-hydroxy-6-metoxy-1,4-benzoquinol methylase|nr:methyltransferase domain-containing protein [Actinomycetota bacterium]